MKKRAVVVFTILFCIMLVGCGSKESGSPAVAVVNGVRISQKNLDQQYTILKTNYESQLGSKLDEAKDQDTVKKIRDRAFEEIVVKELVRQDAAKQGLQVSQGEIDSALETFKQTQNSAQSDGYQKILDSLQMSEPDLRTEIEISQLYGLLEDKVTADVQVTDAEAREYYSQNQALFKNPGGIRIYHILVDTEPLANEIITRINRGENFAALAAQYSLDPGSKNQGGDVGIVNDTTNFVPEFKQAALALQPGQLGSTPIKSQYGYHIIKAGEKQPASQSTFEQVKVQLMEQLTSQKKEEAFSKYLQTLQDAAVIEDLRK